MRELALKAIGAIDVQAAQNEPEIQALVAREEHRNGLLERLQAGNCSPEDLAQGLKEPMAASKLAELGAAGKDSLPDRSSVVGTEGNRKRGRFGTAGPG